jgi:hypothetical protein
VAQLFSLGGYTFMKITLFIILSAVILCGCSKKPAIGRIQAGRDIAWLDGEVLHIEKRDGYSLEGIRIVHKLADGSEETTTADKGTFMIAGKLPSLAWWHLSWNFTHAGRSGVVIILQDAHYKNATTNQISKTLWYSLY